MNTVRSEITPQSEIDEARARIFGAQAGAGAPDRGLYADEEAARQDQARRARQDRPEPDNAPGDAGANPGEQPPRGRRDAGNPPPPENAGGPEAGPEMRGRYHEAVIRLGEEMNRQAVIDAADGRAHSREEGFRHQVDLLQGEIDGICDVNTGEVFWDERVYRLEAVVIQVVNPRLYRDLQALQIDPATGDPRVLDNVDDQNHLHDLQMDAHMLFLGVLQHEKFAHGNELDYLMMIRIPDGDLYHAHNEHQRPPQAEAAPAAARAAGPTPDWQRNLDAALGLDDDAAREAALRQWFREYGATAPGRAIHRADAILGALRRHEAPRPAGAGVEAPNRDFNGWRQELRRALALAEREFRQFEGGAFGRLPSSTGEGGPVAILVMARRQLGIETAEVLDQEAKARENLHNAFVAWFKNRKAIVRLVSGENIDGVKFNPMEFANIGVLANLGTEADPKGLGRQIGRAIQLYIQLGETGLQGIPPENQRVEIQGRPRRNFFNVEGISPGELNEIRAAIAAETGSREAEQMAFRLIYVLGLAARFNPNVEGGNEWGDNSAQYIYAAKRLQDKKTGPIYGRGGPYGERKYTYDALGPAPLAMDALGLIDADLARVHHTVRMTEGDPTNGVYEALRDGRFADVDWARLGTLDTDRMAKKFKDADDLWKILTTPNMLDKDFNFSDTKLSMTFGKALGHLPREVQGHIKVNWMFAVLKDHDRKESKVAPANRWQSDFMKAKLDEAERAGFIDAYQRYELSKRMGFFMVRAWPLLINLLPRRDWLDLVTGSPFTEQKRR